MIKGEVLIALKKEMESRYVRTMEQINDSIKYFGGQKKIFIADDINFRIDYILQTDSYSLETTFSNQKITKEWVDKLNRIRKIIEQD